MFHRIKKKIIFYLVSAVCIILSLSLLTFLKSPILGIFRFPLIVTNAIKNELVSFINFHSLKEENLKLKQENQRLKKLLITLQEQEKENQRLKKLFSFYSQNKSHFYIPAHVISKDSSHWIRAVIIDKGKKDGIKPNLPVVTDAGLVGKVFEVSSYTSKIILLNDPNLFVTGLIQSSRYQGLISGRFLNSLKMQYLPEDAKINKQDIVVSAGIDLGEVKSIYPKGIPIGEIIDVMPDAANKSQTALIKPFVDFNALEEVLVVR